MSSASQQSGPATPNMSIMIWQGLPKDEMQTRIVGFAFRVPHEDQHAIDDDEQAIIVEGSTKLAYADLAIDDDNTKIVLKSDGAIERRRVVAEVVLGRIRSSQSVEQIEARFHDLIARWSAVSHRWRWINEFGKCLCCLGWFDEDEMDAATDTAWLLLNRESDLENITMQLWRRPVRKTWQKLRGDSDDRGGSHTWKGLQQNSPAIRTNEDVATLAGEVHEKHVLVEQRVLVEKRVLVLER